MAPLRERGAGVADHGESSVSTHSNSNISLRHLLADPWEEINTAPSEAFARFTSTRGLDLYASNSFHGASNSIVTANHQMIELHFFI